MTALPVTVLTGFLGAGKTTFLARALRRKDGEDHGLRIGLIINEIGVAGTDGIAMSESEYLELTEGCVCCTRNPDLIAALAEYAARGDLDRVIIETTGVADPLALTFVLERPDVVKLARLDAVVTVVDAANWRLTESQPEWQAQVATADLIVVTKTDLADDLPALEARLDAMNPVARRFRNDVPLSVLLDAPAPPAPRTAREHARHGGFDAVSITGTTVYRANDLEDLLETLPLAVYRAKGVVARDDGRWMSFHVVAGRLQLDLGVPAPAHGESRIVLIGQGLDREALAALFAECAAVSEPRPSEPA